MNSSLNTIQTDVLVIGGGFAGNFAAIKAAEAGAKVWMAVKGRAGRSGLTPWANSWFVFKDTRGATREDVLRQFALAGDYLNNVDFTELLLAESTDRYEEISSWGAVTGRSHYYQHGTVTRSIEVVNCGDAMRKKAKASGVSLLERVMITSLIKQEDRVIGATGFHMETGETYAILAKAVVMCAGPASFKPLGMGYACCAATGDGDAMAYRAGAEISGKEFNDAHPAWKMESMNELPVEELLAQSPLRLGGGPPGAEGPEETLNGAHLGLRIDPAFGFHQGGNPIDPAFCAGPGGKEKRPAPEKGPTGFSTIGMSNHKGEGIFPQDINGASNVTGLWGAGDGLCSMQNGAGYAGFGCSCAGSAVQGARAGTAAARFAASQNKPSVSPALLQEHQDAMLAPIQRTRGYSPAWVTRLMQNTMFPYYVLYVKEKSRMEAALSQIQFLQTRFSNALCVEDFHGLRLAHETQNMLLNAEMKLTGGLARE